MTELFVLCMFTSTAALGLALAWMGAVIVGLSIRDKLFDFTVAGAISVALGAVVFGVSGKFIAMVVRGTPV